MIDIITNVDDDVDQMWIRLHQKYGQPIKLVDLIMREIKLVNVIERDYRALKIVHFEKGISNVTALSMIEALLPSCCLSYTQITRKKVKA